MTMLEKLARALHTVAEGPAYEKLPESAKRLYREGARAILTELREPRQSLLEAMHDGLCPREFDGSCWDRLKAEWQQGIDEILKEGQ